MKLFSSGPAFFSVFAVLAVFLAAVPCAAAEGTDNTDNAGAAGGTFENGWVVAASEFELVDVPEVYSSYAELVPSLLLDRLLTAQIRLVGIDEKRSRMLQVKLNERIKLVSERRELVLNRDSLFFSPESSLEKDESKAGYDELIEEKNSEIQALDAEIEEDFFSGKDNIEDENVSVVLWKNGDTLYTPAEDRSLAESLYNDGISALVTGEIRDIGGYMYISASLDTGYGNVASTAVSRTAHYDDLQDVIFHLSLSLASQVANRRPVRLHVSVYPEDASVFIDSFLIQDGERPVVVFAGTHTIEASAPGFASSIRTADFIENDEFEINITLKPLEKMNLAFDTKKVPASIFFRTQYFGQTPQTVSLPAFPMVGEAVHGDVQTFFVLNPGPDLPEDVTLVTEVVPDKKNTEKRIEKQRKIFYWSLGLLYMALPAAFLIRGEADSRLNAYNSGRLEQTQENVDNINAWITAGNITTGICIGLGINLVFQLVRYILAAEQATPQQPEL